MLPSIVATTFPPTSPRGDGGELVTVTELTVAPILAALAWILGSARAVASVLNVVIGIESANPAPPSVVITTPIFCAWLKPSAASAGVKSGSW